MSVFNNGGYVGISRRYIEPITFVGGKSIGGLGTTADIVISLTDLVGGIGTKPVKGDVVIVAFSTGSTVNRDLVIAGFTEIADLYADDTYDTNLAVAYKVMGDTPDTSVTLTGGSLNTADAYAVAIHVWRNVDPITPLDVTSTTATASNSGLANPPAITPVTQGAFVIVIGAAAHASGTHYFASPESAVTTFFTAGADDTNDATVGMGVYREWTSGAYDPAAFRLTVADSGSNSWAAVTMALRPRFNVNGSTGMWNVQSDFRAAKRFFE